jgi:acylphosphatase
VGFRYTAQNIAMRYDVRGYVRNLSDGCVELVIEGPETDIDHVIQAIKQRMDPYITGTTTNQSPPTGEFDRFTIKH